MLNLPRFYSIGAIAQLVEHRTENPGVPGSIPGGTTAKPRKPLLIFGSSGAFQLRGGDGSVVFKRFPIIIVTCEPVLKLGAMQIIPGEFLISF